MRNFSFILFIIISLTACKKDDDLSQQQGNMELAIVVIYPVEDIVGDNAIGGGEVANAGNSEITHKGLVWSNDPEPALGDNITSEGAGTDGFFSEMSALEFNSIYYVRAYAINAVGVSYSDEISFNTTNECTLNVFEGNITLTTQSEIIAFGLNNYCKITGDLVFQQPQNATTDLITDLSPLSNLRYVRSLRVEDTTILESLQGLDNVSVIFDTLNVYNNEGITDLDELELVSAPLTGISVVFNDQLTNIDGISNIPGLIPPTGYPNPSFIYIQRNPLLQNIDGLQGIQSIQPDSQITIGGLLLITNLNGLQQIFGEMGRLQLVELPQLTNIDGLRNITSVNDELLIFRCDILIDLSGMTSLEFVEKSLTVSYNENLVTLDGLSNLSEIRNNLVIRQNGLTDFCAIQNLFGANGVGGSVFIEDNTYNPSQQDIIDGNCSL